MHDSDLILAIETSNPSAQTAAPPHSGPGVCLADASRVRAHAPIEPRDRHDDGLLPAIDRVFHESGARRADLGLVGVSIGPGGYTAIRIAVSVAKSIGEALSIGCVGVPTAEGVVRATGVEGPSLVALAWKRRDVWVQPFGADHAAERAGRIVVLDDVPALAHGRTLIAEPRLRAQLGAIGAFADPVFSAQAVAQLARTIDPVDPAALLPLYPREPEAVRKWHARGA